MYTAGEVYISSIIDTLTAQACYNPSIITILQQILVGRTEGNSNPLEEFLEDRFKDEFVQSNIWQIPVPEEMINKTYEKLFKFLLDKGLVPIGLYRLPGASDNKYPFVSTNPDPNITIMLCDRVFVLGYHIPRELIVENNREMIEAGVERQPQGDELEVSGRNKWNAFLQQEDSTKKTHSTGLQTQRQFDFGEGMMSD